MKFYLLLEISEEFAFSGKRFIRNYYGDQNKHQGEGIDKW